MENGEFGRLHVTVEPYVDETGVFVEGYEKEMDYTSSTAYERAMEQYAARGRIDTSAQENGWYVFQVGETNRQVSKTNPGLGFGTRYFWRRRVQ